MGIARKVLALNLFLTLAAMLIIFGVGHRLWTSGYLKLEEEAVLSETNRMAAIIDAENAFIATMVEDWGAWDELYEAVTERKTQQFVERNLTKETIKNFKIDFTLICESDGKIIALKGRDDQAVQIKPELMRHAGKIAAALPSELRPESLRRGVIIFEDGPMLIAAQRIAKTDFSGSSPGILIFIRALDETYFTEINQRDKVSLKFLAAPQAVTENYWQRIVDGAEIRGYRVIRDFYGEKSCLLEVGLERKIFRQGEQMMREYALLTLIIGLLVSCGTLLLLRKLVLRRLERLDNFMNRIVAGEKAELDEEISGNDELSRTARTVKSLLEKMAESETELRSMSLLDGLTGLYNRAFLQLELEQIGRRSFKRIGVVVCDVDGLKIINDTMGHEIGDEMLKQTARLLTSVFAESGKVIRLGGDEFLVLVYDQSEEFIEQCLRRIREQMEMVKLKHEGFNLRVSLGASVAERSEESPLDGARVTSLIRDADDAMYRKKLAANSENKRGLLGEIIKMLDSRDRINEGHGERVAELALRLARVAAVPSEKMAGIALLGKLHDIGKVGVADEIVFKAGALTPEEMLQMERHPEIGYRIAQAIPEVATIADLILKHHEWWNGKGYPLGLRGQEIPLEARVLAIVDAYDEMTTDRPYRNGISKEEALAEIERMAGKQFDPELVLLFVSLMKT